MVDYIYIAASAHDARYTRICVASVRHFYPQVPIRLLAGGTLQRGLVEELQRYWDVQVAELPRGDYGWGFVKLEPLFGPPGERFLVLDSDTVLAGPILDVYRGSDASFLVDDEQLSEADTHRLYYDWQKVRAIDPQAQPPQFVFNSGQWFGTAGILTREDFAPLLEWSMPPRLRYPQHFMPGEQGILNYVLNQKAILDRIQVARQKIMRWPVYGMQGLEAETVAKGIAAPLVVHWAGIKKARQRDMIGADLLTYFEKLYYQRLPLGGIRRIVAGYQNTSSELLRLLRVMTKLRISKLGAIFTPGNLRSQSHSN